MSDEDTYYEDELAEARAEVRQLRAAALALTQWAVPEGYASFHSGNGVVPMVRWDELSAALSLKGVKS